MMRRNHQRLFLSVCSMIMTPLAISTPNSGGMKMYVFPETTSLPEVSVTRKSKDGGEQAMKMVLFATDAGPSGAGVNAPAIQQHQSISQAAPAAEALEQYPRREQSDQDWQVKTHAEAGYRHDQLKWNKAAPGGHPNILSELQWNNVHSATLSAGTEVVIDKRWLLEGNLSYGQILSGDNQDSDYELDNRQGEFSRSNNAANDGTSIDLLAGVGRHLTLGNPKQAPYWRFTPKLGYAFHTQQFNMTKGYQTIPNTGSFSGLDSTYEGTWFGPWGGMATELALTRRLSLEASMRYHWIDYEGTGHWNLRGDLQQPVSFKHSADGEGIVANATLRFNLTPTWIIRLTGQYENWLANDNGKDKMFGAGGGSAEMRFNEVKWQSYGLNLGMEYVF